MFLARRLYFSSHLTSGLRIKVLKGELDVNAQRHSEVILWSDTSPESVLFSIVSKQDCELKIWNVWRVNDIVQAWIGNSGILVTEGERFTKLECSGGTELVDFSTLIFQIERIDENGLSNVD